MSLPAGTPLCLATGLHQSIGRGLLVADPDALYCRIQLHSNQVSHPLFSSGRGAVFKGDQCSSLMATSDLA